MLKTKIEFVDYTWKIATGCLHNCSYCYVKRFTTDMTPKFHPERLNEPLLRKNPSMIFVANTGDLFGKWVDDNNIKNVITITQKCPQHIFLFLTKNPDKMSRYSFGKNCWVGTSITKQEDLHRIDSLKKTKTEGIHFISFEPLLGYITLPEITDIEWAIVGAETEKNSYTPKNEEQSIKWANPLVDALWKLKIPMFLKDNLKWACKVQDFPLCHGTQKELF